MTTEDNRLPTQYPLKAALWIYLRRLGILALSFLAGVIILISIEYPIWSALALVIVVTAGYLFRKNINNSLTDSVESDTSEYWLKTETIPTTESIEPLFEYRLKKETTTPAAEAKKAVPTAKNSSLRPLVFMQIALTTIAILLTYISTAYLYDDTLPVSIPRIEVTETVSSLAVAGSKIILISIVDESNQPIESAQVVITIDNMQLTRLSDLNGDIWVNLQAIPIGTPLEVSVFKENYDNYSRSVILDSQALNGQQVLIVLSSTPSTPIPKNSSTPVPTNSSTPVPTNSSTPKLEPTPIDLYTCTARDNFNVRLGPGIEYQIVTILWNGTSATTTSAASGTNDTIWFELDISEILSEPTRGWIHNSGCTQSHILVRTHPVLQNPVPLPIIATPSIEPTRAPIRYTDN